MTNPDAHIQNNTWKMATKMVVVCCAVSLISHIHRRPDLLNILPQSYYNAAVTINLQCTSNLPNILQRTQGCSWVGFSCKIAISSEIVLVYISIRENLACCKSLSRVNLTTNLDNLTINCKIFCKSGPYHSVTRGNITFLHTCGQHRQKPRRPSRE